MDELKLCIDRPAAPANRFGWFNNIILPLVPGVALFVVGYLFVDSVRLSNETPSVHTATAEKIESYFVELFTGEKTNGDLLNHSTSTAKAIALAAFGQPAILPLILVLNQGGELQAVAGSAGLHHVGLRHHRDTCHAIGRTVSAPSQAYKWQTHKRLLELLPILACQQTDKIIGEFESNWDQYGNAWFYDDMTEIQESQLQASIDNARARFNLVASN